VTKLLVDMLMIEVETFSYASFWCFEMSGRRGRRLNAGGWVVVEKVFLVMFGVVFVSVRACLRTRLCKMTEGQPPTCLILRSFRGSSLQSGEQVNINCGIYTSHVPIVLSIRKYVDLST